jgi:hypothetical protein
MADRNDEGYTECKNGTYGGMFQQSRDISGGQKLFMHEGKDNENATQ